VLKEAARKVAAGLAVRSDVRCRLKGSLVEGTADVYSDIDIEVLLPGSPTPADHAWARAQVEAIGRLVAIFPATHIGLEHLIVAFVDVDDEVVKVDIELTAAQPATSAEVPVGSPGPDFADIHQKFTGWIWYTWTKIARGELLEAVDAIGGMRSLAVLPCLHAIHGLPYTGYRRLEERLPGPVLDCLRTTYPSRPDEPEEIARALLALCNQFAALQPDLVQHLGSDHQGADLSWMIRHVSTLAEARV
jgi:hypothetical protein